jgi:serine protease AprX
LRRTVLCLVIFFLSVGTLAAQSGRKFDRALEERVKKARDSRGKSKSGSKGQGSAGSGSAVEKVRVIIQSDGDPDGGGVSEHVRKNRGAVGHKFETFAGMAVEIPVDDLETLSSHSKIKRVSLDVPVSLNNYDVAAFLGSLDVNKTATGAPQAWFQYGVSGKAIGIAVIDSGIASMSDLNVKRTVDFTSSPSWSADPYGHGTHVAGILSGRGNGSTYKYLGVAPEANLVNLRALDSNGRGMTSDVIRAIDWAVANRNSLGSDGLPLNIRVINLSLGHAPYEPASTDPLAIACRRAVQAGMVVVASAGNYGKDANGNTMYGSITSPGIEPSVITVGAMSTWDTPSRADDVVATYSSRGPTRDGLMKPDVVAPGSRVVGPKSPYNKLALSNPSLSVDGSYMRLSGTSMAAPVVSGVAALILEKNPYLTPNAVKAILMYTAEKRGNNPYDTGAGYINALGAVNFAANINPFAATSQYWLNNSGTGLTRADSIAGYTAVWGGTIVWSETLFSGNTISYNDPAWASTIVWGEKTSMWSTTIVWESLSTLNVWLQGQTIVWDTLNALGAVFSNNHWEDQ